MTVMENFDYEKAVAELERIAQLVEDPSTGLGDIDRYTARSAELIKACREYLRTVESGLDRMDK